MKTILEEGKKWKLNDFVSKRYSFRVKFKKKENLISRTFKYTKYGKEAWELFIFWYNFSRIKFGIDRVNDFFFRPFRLSFNI